jgi:hypothetical protein
MKSKQLLLAGGALLAINAVSAESSLDLAQPLVCAATQVVMCAERADCERGHPEAFNLPVLFRVDIAKKVVESQRVSGEKRVSTIGSVTQGDGKVVLQGVDGSSGWSAGLDQSTGALTLVSADYGVTYSVFGTCVAL